MSSGSCINVKYDRKKNLLARFFHQTSVCINKGLPSVDILNIFQIILILWRTFSRVILVKKVVIVHNPRIRK